MKVLLGISIVLAMTLLAANVLATVTGTAGIICNSASDCTTTILNLCAKDSTTPTWQCLTNGATGTLTFGTVGPTFKGTLITHGLIDGNYALIYKPDTADRFTTWTGIGGKVIATFTGAQTNGISLPIDTNLGINLPIPADWNAVPPADYCNKVNTWDSYAHCTGAKIWIVPTSDLTGSNNLPLTAWNPTTYLFETDLVTYTVGNPTATCVNGQCVPITCGISTSGSPDFGSIVPGAVKQSGITTLVTNTGNVQVTPLISGANWVGTKYATLLDGYWMPVGATQWTDTIWANVVPLTTTPTSMGVIGISGTATVSYQLTVPSPQPTDTYSQTITFGASC
ncbi:MAG: hypothetical protein NTW30_03285 [Candidatus Aenigmarchaeota archaeon]|nr:hypothetical protein [Candidatus Aenigmarchaeota archaeon]